MSGILGFIGGIFVAGFFGLVGFVVIIFGLISSPQPSFTPSNVSSHRRNEVSSLAKAILVGLPHGKTIEEVSRETGVDESVVVKKVQDLKSGGLLTEGGKLTQEGYEAIQP